MGLWSVLFVAAVGSLWALIGFVGQMDQLLDWLDLGPAARALLINPWVKVFAYFGSLAIFSAYSDAFREPPPRAKASQDDSRPARIMRGSPKSR